jgi:hypothetical protein
MSDLSLDANSDLEISNLDLRIKSGLEYVEQRHLIKLRTFLGEYALDRFFGVDYYGKFLIQNPDAGIMEAEFKKTIFEMPETLEILEFDMNINNQTKVLSITYKAKTTEGIVDIEEDIIL